MGCCLSTTVATTPTKSPDGKFPESDVKGGANPPASVLDEEETVKEVLSETQTPISTAPSSSSAPKIPIQHTPTLRNSKLTSKAQLQPSDHRLKETIKEQEQEEISVVSEMHSASGSFSTTTVNDGEESGEVDQRISIHHRSQAANKRSNNYSCVNARAKHGGPRSLQSSSDPRDTTGSHGSPVPSSQVKSRPRPAQGRTATVQRRNVGRRDRDWQGLVERIGSPAAVSQVIRHQRTAVSGVTGHPGGRSRVRKLGESKRIENHDGAVSRESLDNPRVSLECFIFL